MVAVAAQIADERGLDALTLAEVANRLGVRTPSLYGHVGGLDELRRRLRLMGLETMRDGLRRATMGRSGRDALTGLTGELRAFGAEHPGQYQATVPSHAGDADRVREAAGSVLEVVLAVLAGYGLASDDAVHAARFVRSAVHGFIDLEAAGGFGLPVDLDASFAMLVRQLDRSLRAWHDAGVNAEPSVLGGAG